MKQNFIARRKYKFMSLRWLDGMIGSKDKTIGVDSPPCSATPSHYRGASKIKSPLICA